MSAGSSASPGGNKAKGAASGQGDQRALASAVRAVSGVTLLSRVGGLMRDVIVARVFGDTWLGSAFAAAFAIPNMFRRLFGEGALSAAFIPAYTRSLRGGVTQGAAAATDPSEIRPADRLASLTVAVLGAITGLITVLVIGVLLVLTWVLPSDAERELSLRLIIVMMPFMPLICIVAILAGMLQVHGRFGAASSGPLVLNAFIVGVGLYFVVRGEQAGAATAYALGAATVASGVTQLWWFLRLLKPHAKWTINYRAAVPEARAMLRKFVPVAIGLGTLQLNALVDTLIAMYPIWVGDTIAGRPYPLDEASNVVLSMAQRLYQFPLGVFGIAVATAVFPLLARHAAQAGSGGGGLGEASGDWSAFALTLRRGVRLSIFIGLPASVGLVFVAPSLTAVLYGHGSSGFSAQGVERASAVVVGFAVGVWAYSVNHVLTRAFYAMGDTSTPMRVSLAMVVLNLGLNLTLIWSLREAGMAWATSIAAVVQTCVLGTLLRRRLAGIGAAVPGDEPSLARGVLRVVAASAIMGTAVWATLWALPEGRTWTDQLLRAAAATGVGGAVYLAAAVALRTHELWWLLLGLSRRRTGGGAGGGGGPSAAGGVD